MLRNFTLLLLAPTLAIANPSERQKPSPLLPLHFETDPAHPDRYLVLGAGYKMSIGANDTNLWAGSARIRTVFVDANRHAQLRGLDPMDCRVNYIQGSSASRWRYGVKAYQRLAVDCPLSRNRSRFPIVRPKYIVPGYRSFRELVTSLVGR